MTNDSKNIVLSFFAAAAKKDRKIVRKCLAEEIDWEDNGPPEMKGGGHFHGPDAVIDYIWGNIRDTRDLQITPEWIISEADKVVVLIHEQATIVETERFYEIHSIHVYTVQNHQIVKFINYFDSMPLLRALYDIEFREAGRG
jgi:ketosteroid isomerase-like protein